MRRKLLILASIAAVAYGVYWTVHTIWLWYFELPEVSADLVNDPDSVYMANGIKVGEVSAHSAIVWTRLTRDPAVDPETRWGRIVTGVRGDVRVSYWPVGDEALKRETPWQPVHPDKDFTRQVPLDELTPGTDYTVLVEGRPPGHPDNVHQLHGHFRTAPGSDDGGPVRFSIVTCQEYHFRDDEDNGNIIYRTMNSMDLDFFVLNGDIIYYDTPKPYAASLPVARFKWNRMFSMPYQRAFFNNNSSYFLKDDHDTLRNDTWPGQTYEDLTFEQGLGLFREQVPMGASTYRTYRWGKHLQIWMVEGRDFRSPNTMPDGPDKTIWGAEQKRWFFDSVKDSDATYKILITPTPILGPDRDSKKDNHANATFRTEGEEIRAFLGSQENMFVICGDRHWQYVSEDPDTGLVEFCSGPATDKLAAGFKLKDRSPMHRYLNITGGFLSVEVAEDRGIPGITFTHHGVDGSVNNIETFSPQPKP